MLELILDQREELALRSVAEDDGATTSEATRQLAQTTTLEADDILEARGELLQRQDVLVGTILSDLDLLELGTSRDDDLHRAGRITFVALSSEGEACLRHFGELEPRGFGSNLHLSSGVALEDDLLRTPFDGKDKVLKVGGEDDVTRGLTDGDALLQATSIDDDRADAVVAQVIGLSTDLQSITLLCEA